MPLHSTPARQGGNSTAVRHFNERRLLTVLRRLGEASKGDLAAHLTLTQNTVGQIVQTLESQGLIASTGRRMGRRGQPATLLHLDPHGAYALGIKLGRRAVQAALVDFTGGVLKSRRFECLYPTPAQALALALRGVTELRRALPTARRGRLLGVGLALPCDLGRWPIEMDWNDYDLAESLRAATGMPVWAENDCTAAAVAELFHGHGRTCDDFICITINSSIGAGVVLDGDYRRGVSGNAGDISLVPVQRSALMADPSATGEPAILLQRASGFALFRHVEAHGIAIARAVDLHAVMRSHAAIIDAWLQDCAEALVAPLLAMTRLLDVQTIILDGNLPRALIAALLARLEQALAAATPDVGPRAQLRLGSSGKHPAALGAALLPLHSRHGQASLAATSARPPPDLAQ
ncbi:ROK family protein [Lichenicoccus sp.]|uniref:ROK family protein n=1 Tax=Lichenicoccus sp. TaxID=2781899 RepID=UPI003D12AAE6